MRASRLNHIIAVFTENAGRDHHANDVIVQQEYFSLSCRHGRIIEGFGVDCNGFYIFMDGVINDSELKR